MIKKKTSSDGSRNNLNKLIELCSQYREMQYTLFEQYNLVLEDPRFDTMYLDIEPIIKYRKYIETDLNGTENHSSTTQIIKEFKKLLESYDYNVENYKHKDDSKVMDLLNR